jgi:hypothetical protein
MMINLTNPRFRLLFSVAPFITIIVIAMVSPATVSGFAPIPSLAAAASLRKNSSATEMSMMMPLATATVVANKVLTKATAAVVAGAVVAVAGTVKFVFDQPSRTYGQGTVGQEYDAWTSDGTCVLCEKGPGSAGVTSNYPDRGFSSSV